MSVKSYTFERAEKVASAKPYRPRLEYGLIPKKMKEHLDAEYRLIN